MFKPGDEVICINPGEFNPPIKKGECYIIERVEHKGFNFEDCVYLTIDRRTGFFAHRFVLKKLHEYNKEFEEFLEEKNDFLPKKFKSHKKTLWLLPFVECVKDIIPINKLVGLKGYKVTPKKHANQYGSCVQDVNGTFVINMRLYRWDEITKQHITMYQGHLLETFAHELSHMIPGCWNHNAKHMKYTGLILARFSKVIKKQGISDTYKHRMNYDEK